MADVASLGLAVDSSQVSRATEALNRLGPAAKTAGKDVEGLGQSSARTETQQRALEASAKRLGITVAEMEARTRAASATLSQNGERARVVEQANLAAARAMGGVASAAGALGDGLGRVHPMFGFLGGGALSLTVIIVGLTAAYRQLRDAAMALADRAGGLKDFSETTGFTVVQLQALEKAGAQVGVSGEKVSRGLERFSVSMDDLKKGVGPAYESLLEINPELARQFTTVTSLADAWDLFAKATKAADLEQANKLARAVFGREGVPITRLLRASADAGGLAGLIKDLEKVGLITAQQADQWDTLGDTINENMKAAKQNIAAIFTGAVLEGMNRFASGFLDLSVTLRNFTLGEDFKKFLEWSKSPVGMAVLAGGAGAALGAMVAGPVGALVGGGTGAILGAARGVEYANRPTAGGTQVAINGGSVDVATTALVAQAKALDDQKRALAASIAEQERYNSVAGAAVTPAETLRLGIDKLKLAFLEGKISADQLAKAQSGVNAQFSSQQFSTYIGLLGQAASVEEQVQAKRNAINDAARQQVFLTKEQIATQIRLTRESALGIMQIKASTDAYTAEAQTIGMGTGAAMSYIAVQNQINEAKRNGRVLTQDNIDAIQREADAMGRAAEAVEETRFRYETFKGAFVSFGQYLRQSGDAWGAFKQSGLDALGKISDKLMSMAADNLWKAAFGGATSGGGLGGILSGLFGGGGASGGIALGGPAGPGVFAAANGGTFGPGWGVVGERGPELIKVHSGAVSVVPNHISRPYLPGFATGGTLTAGGNVTRLPGGQDNAPLVIHYSPTIDARGADAQAVARLAGAMAQDRKNFERNVQGVVARTRANQPGSFR